ncbi:response regulator transcription factor [Deinococcus sp.]|uniref:response regulator transcription factor n=1 Tax=Deinococcus sp. TaxID=47478 RepID=UPI0025FD8184|nr:response regulator transcription factor [Deinococcus sp.]
MRLLIVEDDPHIAELLREGLGEDGYECDHAASASEAEALAHLFPYALLLLDVTLPEGPDAGYRLGERLRSAGLRLPILYLSARAAVEDRVSGLEAGGDDYLVKPFAFRELRARLRALLRRSGGSAHNSVPLPGGWHLDLGGRELHCGGRRAELTRREFALIELLALHPGRAFSRPELIERLWRGEAGVELKVIDVYVSTLRRKTSEALIDTVRGTGYRLGRAEP